MFALMLALALIPAAQDPAEEITRAEEYRIARETKAEHLEPPRQAFLEKALFEFKDRRMMERFQAGYHGFHPLLGGMTTGSGFAFGGAYVKDDVQASAQVSVGGYQRYKVQYSPARFLPGPLFADVHAVYRNYNQEPFYGVGSDSRSESRTNYRLEDVTLGGRAGARLTKTAKAGVDVNWIDADVKNGALNLQPQYLRTGVFLEMDTRDEPGNPRDGGLYAAKWSSFRGPRLGHAGFGQYDVEVQQYLPFFNQRRVIALRAKTTLTQATGSEEIPFFMLPSVGGSEDLRGYEEFRFRDRNMVVVNAEYRWEAFSGLDLALFADAGQVAARVRDFDVREMKTAAGFGFRFNTAKSVFWRVDVGFSREGTRVFMKFGHVF